MIEDDKQLQITIDWIGKFANSVSNLTKQELPTTTNDKLRHLSYLNSYVGEIEVLLEQVNDYWNEDKEVTVMQQELDLTEIVTYIQRLSDDDVRYELYFTLLEQLHTVHLDNVTLMVILKSIKDRKNNVSDIMEQLYQWCSDNNVNCVM